MKYKLRLCFMYVCSCLMLACADKVLASEIKVLCMPALLYVKSYTSRQTPFRLCVSEIYREVPAQVLSLSSECGSKL